MPHAHNFAPYEVDGKCPKCGFAIMKDTYTPAPPARPDTIKRECMNCGYWWRALPLDAEEGE